MLAFCHSQLFLNMSIPSLISVWLPVLKWLVNIEKWHFVDYRMKMRSKKMWVMLWTNQSTVHRRRKMTMEMKWSCRTLRLPSPWTGEQTWQLKWSVPLLKMSAQGMSDGYLVIGRHRRESIFSNASVFRSTPPSRPNNIYGLKNVRPFVRPSVRSSVHKKFLWFQWNLVCR